MKIKSIRNFIWFITLIIISFGFFPYKFTFNKSYKSQPNVLLVKHGECTCCGDFRIIEGKAVTSDSLQKVINNEAEIEVIGEKPPLNQFSDETKTLDLLNNSIVITGEVVGIDNTDGCTSRLVFLVKRWKLITYYPRFMTFDANYILVYLLTCVLAIFLSIYYLFKKKSIKNQASPPV